MSISFFFSEEAFISSLEPPPLFPFYASVLSVLMEGRYFPKGSAHGVQGLDENNEFLIAFDDGKFDVPGTTFQVDDWIAHTPKDILAKNFGQ